MLIWKWIGKREMNYQITYIITRLGFKTVYFEPIVG